MADARLTAVKMLLKMEDSDSYSNILLDSVLSESDLNDRDKAFAAALFYGVTERRLTLDHVIEQNSNIPFHKLDKAAVAILRVGLYQLLFMDSVPESAAVNESVKLCKRLKLFSAQGFVNGMLRSFVRNGKKISYHGLEAADRLSVEYSCPKWLAEKWLAEYDINNTVKALKASIGKPPVYARVNTLKTNTDDLLEELRKEKISAKKYTALDNCIILEKTGDIERTKAFRAGLFHVQDISSQLCCLTLRPVVNETVIDMCAAPGGKSFTIAGLMGNSGKIVACDIHPHRVELIKKGAQRLGYNSVSAELNDATEYNKELGQFDRVLCDVPCSGVGVIHRKPDIRYKNADDFDSLPDLQFKILNTSARYLKPGGVIVYSTCTLFNDENIKVFDRFLKENNDFEPLSFDDGDYAKTFLPDGKKDGFFFARARRKEG